MSVLSLPVVFSQSTSPCLEPCCIFRSARFLPGSEGAGVPGVRGALPARLPPRPASMRAHLR